MLSAVLSTELGSSARGIAPSVAAPGSLCLDAAGREADKKSSNTRRITSRTTAMDCDAGPEHGTALLARIEEMGVQIRAEIKEEVGGLKGQITQIMNMLATLLENSKSSPSTSSGSGSGAGSSHSSSADRLFTTESLDGLITKRPHKRPSAPTFPKTPVQQQQSKAPKATKAVEIAKDAAQSAYNVVDPYASGITNMNSVITPSSPLKSCAPPSVTHLATSGADLPPSASGRATPSAILSFNSVDWRGTLPAASGLDDDGDLQFGVLVKRSSAIKSGFSGRTSLPMMSKSQAEPNVDRIESDDEESGKNLTARSILSRTSSFQMSQNFGDYFASRGPMTRSAARRNIPMTPLPLPPPLPVASGPVTRSGARLSMKVDHATENYKLTASASQHLQSNPKPTINELAKSLHGNKLIARVPHQKLSLPLWPRAPLLLPDKDEKEKGPAKRRTGRSWKVGIFFGYPWRVNENEPPMCRVNIEIGKRSLAGSRQGSFVVADDSPGSLEDTSTATDKGGRSSWVIARTICHHTAVIFEHPIDEFTEIVPSPDCEEDILITFRGGFGGPPFVSEDGAVVEKSYGVKRDGAGFDDVDIDNGSDKENGNGLMFGVMPTVPAGQTFNYVIKALTVELRQAIVAEILKRKKTQVRKTLIL